MDDEIKCLDENKTWTVDHFLKKGNQSLVNGFT